MEPRALIKHIIFDGSPEEKRALFGFKAADGEQKILKKFKLWARSNYPRYFQSDDAPFHDDMVLGYIRSYLGQQSGITIGFRGCAKTSILKLFITFVILNDTEGYRKYIKILSKDLKNSKQIVTDVYNLIVEVQGIYGSIFESKDDKKREETMASFTTQGGRKLSSGTVGQTQRGHLQDAYRPDFIIFEDVEDRESVSSIAITESIIQKCDEAITGLSVDGTFHVNANYISDAGVVQWFLNKPSTVSLIIPIVDAQGNPAWDRYPAEKIAELKANADDWEGDYLCDPTRSGDKFFDIDRVRGDLEKAVEPIRTSAGVRYWADYMPHHRYGGGEDLSDGVGGDSCAFGFFDFSTGDLVATADDNQTPPDLFTMEFARVGREFGNCILAPEINNTSGGIAVSTLKDLHYPKIYQREITDKVGYTISKQLGWHTNSKTKPEMFFSFKKDYNDGLINIKDSRVLKEMLAFTKQDLRDAKSSAITRHFDLLLSVVIAWQMKDFAIASSKVAGFYKDLESGGPSKTIASV